MKTEKVGAESGAQPDRAVQIVIEEINSSTGPTGGWLDSPKAVCAEIVARLLGANARELAKHAPRSQADWISVDAGMPQLGQRVLVSVDGEGFKTRTIGIRAKSAWRLASLEKLPTEPTRPIVGKVTHWQPLPNPPGEADAPLQPDKEPNAK